MPIDKPSLTTGPSDTFRPHQGVLLECRDVVSQRVREALARAVTELDVELQERRLAATGAEESQRLIELQVLLRRVAADLDRTFGSGFEKQFQEKAKTANVTGSFYEDGSSFFPELSLVDETEIDDLLLVKNLSARLARSCEGESQDLQTRIAFMLGESDVDSTDNPIGPATICQTIKDICWGQEAEAQQRGAVLEMLVGHLAGAIADIYHDVNALLVSRRVMPNVRARARRGKAAERIAARRVTSIPGASDASDVVKQLFSARSAELPEWTSRRGTAELMRALDGLQKGGSELALGDQRFALEGLGDGGNVIAHLLEAGLGKQVGTLDGIIIDVIATLFDYIFDDARVPAAMKGLIGRLQIPVLKLAMMDHGFFSNRSHPARRLINALAQAGVTWDGPLTADTSLYRTAEALVLRIQNEFADDASVFAAALETFEQYLLEQERLADEKAASLTDRLKQRERQELARKVAEDALAAYRADEDIPAMVREFLGSTWLRAMTLAAMEGGGEGDPKGGGGRWVEFMETLKELVWSVLPMSDAESRQKLVKRLPVILRNVKSGMQAAGLDEQGQKAFFAELVKCHATALKTGVAQSAAQAASRSAAAAASPRPQGRASTFKPPDEEPTPELLELDLLMRGTWLELKDEGGDIRRMRLTWISPARTMYLFANRQGQRALALTRDELMRRFASGEARTADQEPLLDRVVDDVLDELRG